MGASVCWGLLNVIDPGSKRRNATMALVATLVSTLVGLVLAEVVVRHFALAPEIFVVQKGRFRISTNPLIGYELVPHYEADESGAMLDFAGKANHLGFRDREHAIQKAAGDFRVLVLGDSIAQGLGIRDDRAVFTSVLERRLDQKYAGRAEVLNFGVSGYNTQQEVETLREKGLEFASDLVILAYCVNDTQHDSGGIHDYLNRENERNIDRAPRTLMKSALFRLIYAFATTSSEEERDLFSEIKQDSVAQYLGVLSELSREKGFTVMVVYFPLMRGDVEDWIKRDFAAVRDLSRRHGFYFLDLGGAFAACARRGPIVRDAIHPNARGHKCAGEAISNFIESQQIVSQ